MGRNWGGVLGILVGWGNVKTYNKLRWSSWTLVSVKPLVTTNTLQSRGWNRFSLHVSWFVLKILFLVFKVCMGDAPGYLSDLLNNYVHSDNTRFLRSHADQYLLTYRRTFTSYGDKAFNFVPKLWNKLPVILRSADKFKKFKSMLKMHLFPHWNFFQDF